MPKLHKRLPVPLETQEKICSYIRQGNTIETAARCAGIARDTFYDWMSRGRKGKRGYVGFVNAVDQATAEAERINVMAVEMAMKRDWKAAAWWLQARNPKDWGRRDRVEHTGPQGGPIATMDVTKLTDAELDVFIATGTLATSTKGSKGA